MTHFPIAAVHDRSDGQEKPKQQKQDNHALVLDGFYRQKKRGEEHPGVRPQNRVEMRMQFKHQKPFRALPIMSRVMVSGSEHLLATKHAMRDAELDQQAADEGGDEVFQVFEHLWFWLKNKSTALNATDSLNKVPMMIVATIGQ